VAFLPVEETAASAAAVNVVSGCCWWQVVCGRCSPKRAALAYLEDRKERVCSECYAKIGRQTALVGDVPQATSGADKLQRRKAAPVVLQVMLWLVSLV